MEHLREEHRTINRYLAAFRRYLQDMISSEWLDAREPDGVVSYLTESLFQRHEEKEEGVLMPELARLGVSGTAGPLAALQLEHREGRRLTRVLLDAMRQQSGWGREQREAFLSAARAWVAFLRDHMLGEENALFPLAQSRLDEDTDRQVLRQFLSIERDYEEMDEAGILKASAEAFVKRFGARSVS